MKETIGLKGIPSLEVHRTEVSFEQNDSVI